MRDPLIDLLALLGAALAGGVVTAGAIALWHRYEIARIAVSRRQLAAQWQSLGELWAAIDPTDRPTYRLTWGQRTLLALAVARNAVAPITDALNAITTAGGDRNGAKE